MQGEARLSGLFFRSPGLSFESRADEKADAETEAARLIRRRPKAPDRFAVAEVNAGSGEAQLLRFRRTLSSADALKPAGKGERLSPGTPRRTSQGLAKPVRLAANLRGGSAGIRHRVGDALYRISPPPQWDLPESRTQAFKYRNVSRFDKFLPGWQMGDRLRRLTQLCFKRLAQSGLCFAME